MAFPATPASSAMTDHVQISVQNHLGIITLDRPKALNSLSLDMIRALTQALLDWRDDAAIRAVLIRSSSEKAFCAGGDIRFFHEVGHATPQGGSALLEDFFSEEYALNHLIHCYPKPYIALMDGVVMGGGMGVAQGGPACRMRIVTERTKMAMPEVNIGLFPDVGGGYFLSRTAGQLGTYLGVTGEIIAAADALYCDLADVFVPSAQLPALSALLLAADSADIRATIRNFAAPFQADIAPDDSLLARQRALIDRHFGHHTVAAISASLAADSRSVRAKNPGRHAQALAADDVRDAGTNPAQRDAGCRRLPAPGTHDGQALLRAWRSAGGGACAGRRQGQCAAMATGNAGRGHA